MDVQSGRPFRAANEEAMKHAIQWARLRPTFQNSFCRTALSALVLAGCYIAVADLCALTTAAEEAQWIWSPEHTKTEVPEVSCYFRKVFTAQNPIRVQATIAADDEYELYVNGKRIGEGQSSRELDEYNITEHVKRGRNTIAVRVINRRGSTAALVARIFSATRTRAG